MQTEDSKRTKSVAAGRGRRNHQCEIQKVHNKKIGETEDFYKAQKTVKDNCRRLTEIIEWIKVQYHDYYSAAVRELSEE